MTPCKVYPRASPHPGVAARARRYAEMRLDLIPERRFYLMRRQRLGLLTDVKPPATPETVPGLFSLELCQQRSRQGSGYLAPLIHNYGSAANSDRKGSVSTTLAATARGRIECRLRISLLTC